MNIKEYLLKNYLDIDYTFTYLKLQFLFGLKIYCILYSYIHYGIKNYYQKS